MAMDKIFKPEENEFISPLVNFNTFGQVARKQRDCLRRVVLLEPLLEFSYPADVPEAPLHVHKRVLLESEATDDNETTAAKLQKVFGIQCDDARDTVSSLDVSHFALLNKRDIFFRKKVDLEDIPADTELETLKLKKKVLDMFNPIKKKPAGRYDDPRQREQDLKMRRNIQQSICYGSTVLKYGDYYENEMRHCRNDGYKQSIVNDIVVTVVICKPYNKALEYLEKRNATLRPYWRFLLRGETSLLELHSLFRCTADYGTAVDEDKVPQLHDFNMFKYPSSFLFIHDTFYIAETYTGSKETLLQIDHSKIEPHIDISAIFRPIREWMKRKPKDFGPTQVKSLNEGKVKDLVCRLGYPYVYVHQGNCEHVFFFTDLRLMDVQDYPIDFPQKLSDTSMENYCITCHKRIADWILESESFPISPAHMCDDCYRSFHYILSYRRNVDSRAYVYMDPSILQY
ncbi:snRNA-activating protein of 50kDa MW C terminal family protein [Acanthocheilonema viteae]